MRTIVAAFMLLALGACVESKHLFGDEAPGCAQQGAEMPFARNPATGMCVGFASGCDVPAEWAPCTPYVACTDGRECRASEHCADQPEMRAPDVPARACVANDSCVMSSDCADGFVCDTSVPPAGAPDCDPMASDCTPEGTCSNPTTAPPPPPPPPSAPSCLATSECGPLEICPAQYGGCSPQDPNMSDGGVDCPSVCEPACTTDADCGDPATSALRCNAADVCGASNSDAMGNPGLTCAGWCVKR